MVAVAFKPDVGSPKCGRLQALLNRYCCLREKFVKSSNHRQLRLKTDRVTQKETESEVSLLFCRSHNFYERLSGSAYRWYNGFCLKT